MLSIGVRDVSRVEFKTATRERTNPLKEVSLYGAPTGTSFTTADVREFGYRFDPDSEMAVLHLMAVLSDGGT